MESSEKVTSRFMRVVDNFVAGQEQQERRVQDIGCERRDAGDTTIRPERRAMDGATTGCNWGYRSPERQNGGDEVNGMG